MLSRSTERRPFATPADSQRGRRWPFLASDEVTSLLDIANEASVHGHENIENCRGALASVNNGSQKARSSVADRSMTHRKNYKILAPWPCYETAEEKIDAKFFGNFRGSESGKASRNISGL